MLFQRFEIMMNLARYFDLIDYIKAKDAIFFENITTEIDENDVDSFMKVVALQRHLNAVFQAVTIKEFISNLSKQSANNIETLNDNLFEVGPKIG